MESILKLGKKLSLIGLLFLFYTCHTDTKTIDALALLKNKTPVTLLTCGEMQMGVNDTPFTPLYLVVDTQKILIDTVYACQGELDSLVFVYYDIPLEYVVSSTKCFFNEHSICHYAALEDGKVEVFRVEDGKRIDRNHPRAGDFLLIGVYENGTYCRVR